MAAIWLVVRRNPSYGPPTERQGWPARLSALSKVWGVLVLFLVVMGGIYAGFFTATEAAGIGAFVAAIFAALSGDVGLRDMLDVSVEAVRTTAILFFIVVGALLFATYLNAANLPQILYDFV